MATLSPFKRGDTFKLTCTNKIAGVPVSVEGYSIRAQIRTSKGALVAELDATIEDQTASPGVFYLTSNGSTSGWPVSNPNHVCDIQVTANGIIRSSDTFCVPVIDDVTK